MQVKNNILLIAPNFFDYENLIADELRRLGASVTLIDDRPSNSFIFKGLLRVGAKNILNKKISNYYKKVLSSAETQAAEYIFLVNPEATPMWFLNEVKRLYPNKTIICYTWDSFNNKPQNKNFLNFSDHFFTFDSKDAEDYARVNFLPLFFDQSYGVEKVQTKNYDLMFVGTLHSDRYQLVNKLCQQAKYCYSYFYSPSKFLFFFQKIFLSDYRRIKLNEVHFQKLDHSSIQAKMLQSRVIVDIHHVKQSGLTMRTMEALGMNKKIITTNRAIKDYDFYTDQNICIVDREDPQIPASFIYSSHAEIDPVILQRYTITYWVRTIFSTVDKSTQR